MNFDLNKIVRENIKKLVPYSSARDDYKGKEGIFLDANENPQGSPIVFEDVRKMNINRYPDPSQIEVKEKLSKIKELPVDHIFLGNGSDEAIDVLFRGFCEPGKDNVIICPPTYGMYEVSANINNVAVQKINLIPETFQLDTEKILQSITEQTKLIFVCSPNNPTGNAMKWVDIKNILEKFNGILVVDEAYINFSGHRSLITELINFPNLVVLQTLSKAWGMAGLRIGIAFASGAIIAIFNKIKPPYNINTVSQKLVWRALNNVDQISVWAKEIVSEREKLALEISQLDFVVQVYPSDANFILVKTIDTNAIYNYLAFNQIIVRNRSKVALCEGCLRVTIGTKGENETLMNTLKKYAHDVTPRMLF